MLLQSSEWNILMLLLDMPDLPERLDFLETLPTISGLKSKIEECRKAFSFLLL
jgi:hypothetical protein